MLRYLPRILLFIVCAYGAYYFFSEFSKTQTLTAVNVPDSSEEGKAAMSTFGGKSLFNLGGFIVMALISAVVFGLTLLPVIGEIIGGAFFNPPGAIEKNPHHDALAFMAQGDYEAAIAAYRKVVRDNPTDTHAYSEIARLYIEKLGNPAGAAEVFEEALEGEWAPEEGGFLGMRLAEIYWTHFNDPDRAKLVLGQIIDAMPGTRESANANHKIIEIDRALAERLMHPETEEGIETSEDDSAAMPESSTNEQA